VAKKKTNPGQLDLKMAAAQNDGDAKQPEPGNGHAEIVAEQILAAPVHHPFDPNKADQPLHRRVDTSFLEYASYVIRDRAIPTWRTV